MLLNQFKTINISFDKKAKEEYGRMHYLSI